MGSYEYYDDFAKNLRTCICGKLTRIILDFRVFGPATASAVFCLAFIQPAFAQTLDEAIVGLLDNDCEGLGRGDNGPQSFYGPNLNAICEFDSGPGGDSSAGGNTASLQGAEISITQDRALRERLERARAEEEEEDRKTGGGASADASFDLGNGFGVFLSGNYEYLDKDEDEFEDGFDADLYGGTVGADYTISDLLIAGVAFNYNHQDGDFDGGGDFDIDSYGPILYASVLPAPGLFADVVFGYTRKDFDTTRLVSYSEDGTPVSSGPTSSDTEGDEFSVQALVGYDYPIENFTIGPRVGVNYRDLTINGFTEKGDTGLELGYKSQNVTSLQSTVGLFASLAISTAFGVLVPQATASWVHEFEDDQRSIEVQFAEDERADPLLFTFNNADPDRDWGEIGVGVVAVLPNGISPFANFETIVFNDEFNSYAASVGVRFEF